MSASTRFAEYMQKLREAANLTPEKAASKLGIGLNLLKDWEAARCFPPRESARTISRVYNVSEKEWIEALLHANDQLNGTG